MAMRTVRKRSTGGWPARIIGIDIGSTYTKYCILETEENGEGGRDGNEPELFCERTPIMQKEYFEKKLIELREKYGDCPVVTCGYGRKNAGSGRNISELTALAMGAAYRYPESYAVLDIGGQDTKLVCHRNGKIEKFFLNEKCAAGSGMFLGNTLNLLNIPFETINLRGTDRSEIRLSSVCAVFAQSEIVELIAGGTEPMEIVYAVIEQVLIQAKTLLGKTDYREVLLSGGLTRIPGIGEYAERILGVNVTAAEDGSYLAAMGCAKQRGDK